MPNDAYITCLRPGGYPIPDLNLKLKRGESVWVSAGRAATSTDLTTAIKTGAISCSWVDPDAPRLVLATPATQPIEPAQPVIKTDGVVPPTPPNQIECADLLRTILQQELQAVVAQLQQSQHLHQPTPTVDVDKLAGALYRLQPPVQYTGTTAAPMQQPYTNISTPVPVTQTVSPTMDPVYIPSVIMPTTTGTDSIQITAQQSDSGGMDEAAAALRASRAGKPKVNRNRNSDDKE